MTPLVQQLEDLGRAQPNAPDFSRGVMRRLSAPQRSRRERLLVDRRWLIGTAGLAAASATLVVALWYAIFTSAPVAFAQVTRNVRNTHTVSLILEMGQQRDRFISKEGVGTRYESGDGSMVWITNRKAKAALIYYPAQRVAVITRLANRTDAYKWLKGLEGTRPTSIGKGIVNGKEALGFRADLPLPGAPDVLAHTTLWVDPATRLPVQVEQEPLKPAPAVGIPKKVVIRDIRFDTPLKDEQFDVSAPAGYTVQDNRGPATKASGSSNPPSAGTNRP